jgi:hypothetical protein
VPVGVAVGDELALGDGLADGLAVPEAPSVGMTVGSGEAEDEAVALGLAIGCRVVAGDPHETTMLLSRSSDTTVSDGRRSLTAQERVGGWRGSLTIRQPASKAPSG